MNKELSEMTKEELVEECVRLDQKNSFNMSSTGDLLEKFTEYKNKSEALEKALERVLDSISHEQAIGLVKIALDKCRSKK
jgi:hypothetical protein